MDRLGISEQNLSDFLGSRQEKISLTKCVFTKVGDGDLLGLASFVLSVMAADSEFGRFLFERGIEERELIGAADWVETDG